MSLSLKKIILIYFSAIALIVLHIHSFATQPQVTPKIKNPISSPKTEDTQPPLNAETDQNIEEISMEDMQQFIAALMQIKQHYIKNVKNKDLINNAIKGMVANLDPHSSFLEEKENAELLSTTEGKFGGVGLELTLEENVPKVITPLDNSPAKLAGIKTGDYIIKIDNNFIEGMNLSEIIDHLRGDKGSQVKLIVVRKGQTKPLNFTIVRDIIHPQSITSNLLGADMGYVRIAEFQEPTANDFIKAIQQLNKAAKTNLKGLVLDLRNNPGGLLDSAINIADELIDTGPKGEEEVIVSTQGKEPGTTATALATPGDILGGEPIVVLINEGTASAAEIVAGALQDNKRAMLLGTKSFGKGSVQSIIPLDKNHSIKLTTALYYTPLKRAIQAEGLTPDIIIPELMAPTTSKDNQILNITEANLSGHIETRPKPTIGKKSFTDIALPDHLKNDYQLAEAIKILKAIRFAKK